jgi:hypothetical protein
VRSARGGIVLGWLFKLLVMLAIVGVTAFEAGAIVVAKVNADRVAIDAASQAGQVYATTGSVSKAEDAAKLIAAKENATVIKFELINGGATVRVTIEKKASTFIVQHIGFLKKFQLADSTHDGNAK